MFEIPLFAILSQIRKNSLIWSHHCTVYVIEKKQNKDLFSTFFESELRSYGLLPVIYWYLTVKIDRIDLNRQVSALKVYFD